ncbi:MAG TPA: DUF1343 domain-containing protein [Longimicrobiales bacterium]|nr:DUF1343 domain-containing protein [Longimicrobiales bacterium]
MTSRRAATPAPVARLAPIAVAALVGLLGMPACAPSAAPADGVPIVNTIDTTTVEEPGAPLPSGLPEILPEPVRTGIDIIRSEGPGPLAGLRVGLITNHTGVDRTGRSTIDILASLPRMELVALFGPEHGIRGAAQAGVTVEGGRDAPTGLPIFSLYDSTRAPTASELANIDALAFDMQDVGARYYTYIWTMALAMRAAAAHDRLFVVLDRPNPIRGDIVQGNVQDSAFLSFLGLYPMAMRHGMTVAEVAHWLNEEHGIDARLVVVPMRGWRRSLSWEETGLFFTPPSPNMPSPVSALHYPGTCLFEQTSLSVGRGLPTAFQQIGAPWLDHEELARRLNAMELPGVRFETLLFPAVDPGRQSHLGERVPGERRGVRFIATDPVAYDPTRTAVAALVEVARMHPDRLEFSANFDYIAGNARLRAQVLAGADAETITSGWDEARASFEAARAGYLLY